MSNLLCIQESLPFKFDSGALEHMAPAYHVVTGGRIGHNKEAIAHNLMVLYARAHFAYNFGVRNNPNFKVLIRLWPDDDIWRDFTPQQWVKLNIDAWEANSAFPWAILTTQNEPHLRPGETWADVWAWETECVKEYTKQEHDCGAATFHWGSPNAELDASVHTDLEAYDYPDFFRAIADGTAQGLHHLWTPNVYFNPQQPSLRQWSVNRPLWFAYKVIDKHKINLPLWKHVVYREFGITDGWRANNGKKYNLNESQYVKMLVDYVSNPAPEVVADLAAIGVTEEMLKVPACIFGATLAEDQKHHRIVGEFGGRIIHELVNFGKVPMPVIETDWPQFDDDAPDDTGGGEDEDMPVPHDELKTGFIYRLEHSQAHINLRDAPNGKDIGDVKSGELVKVIDNTHKPAGGHSWMNVAIFEGEPVSSMFIEGYIALQTHLEFYNVELPEPPPPPDDPPEPEPKPDEPPPAPPEPPSPDSEYVPIPLPEFHLGDPVNPAEFYDSLAAGYKWLADLHREGVAPGGVVYVKVDRSNSN